MRFEQEVLIWPRNDLERELPGAYLEGTLRIIVGDTRFFEDIGILLIEFAEVAHRWLLECRREPCSLYYVSMDFEEEPILAFCYDVATETFALQSVWAEAELEPLPRDTVITAVASYVDALRDQLAATPDIDFEALLAKAETMERSCFSPPTDAFTR